MINKLAVERNSIETKLKNENDIKIANYLSSNNISKKKKVMIHWFVAEMSEEDRGKFDPVHKKTTIYSALLPLMKQIIIPYHLKIS